MYWNRRTSSNQKRITTSAQKLAKVSIDLEEIVNDLLLNKSWEELEEDFRIET